jgi:hypothetical protein
MNWWWPVMIVLGCAWALPMWGARASGFGWRFFVPVGCMWVVTAALAGPLYDLSMRLRRGLGMTRLAELGERMRPRLLPPARAAMAVMALVSFAFALV